MTNYFALLSATAFALMDFLIFIGLFAALHFLGVVFGCRVMQRCLLFVFDLT